jgi:REP element-mobilizing transposase RayT
LTLQPVSTIQLFNVLHKHYSRKQEMYQILALGPILPPSRHQKERLVKPQPFRHGDRTKSEDLVHLLFSAILPVWRQEFNAISRVCTTATLMWSFVRAYRRNVLIDGIEDRLNVFLRTSVERWEQEFLHVEVMPDRVHFLVGCDPHYGNPSVRNVCEGCNGSCVSSSVSRTETETSESLNEEFLCGNSW